MTPEGRIRESISSLRSQSAWSPMPEHLLFLQLENDKSPTPVTPEGEKKCEDCGMRFKTEAMLTYHKIGFCVGPSTEELSEEEISPRIPRLDAESTVMVDNNTEPQSVPARSGKSSQPTDNQLNAQRQTKLEWCTCANGAVPPSAVKVGYDENDQTYKYICVAQVGDEVIPGTVLPPRKHATVTLKGEEIKATEYSVLTDLEGRVSWKRCGVVGGIPHGAVKGGYDSKNLQYFIARGKSPSGDWFCGKYIPQKQQCYFAWEGTEFTTKDFEFLCEKNETQYFSDKNVSVKPSVEAATTKPEQTTGNMTKVTSQNATLTRDLTGFPHSEAAPSLNTEPNNINKQYERDKSKVLAKTANPNKEATDQYRDKSTKAKEMTMELTDQYKDKSDKAKQITKSSTEITTQGKTSAKKESIKPGSGVLTKERTQTNSARELTQSGKRAVSQDKGKANSSRTNTMVRSNSKNLQF